MKRSCLLLALLLAAPLPAQVEAPQAESTMRPAPGLAASLWASEPLFVNPTCMDIDHKGRVWVVESVNYRNRLRGLKKLNRPQGDRIVILEDTKGAGRADKATTFYQSPDLLAPLGLAVAKDPTGPGCKVFVCQSPDILVFLDADGDGKADGPPRKLLSGFRGFDHDHGVHGILIGPDKKLYFSVGDSGVAGLQSAGGKGRKWTSNDTDCRAGTVWRCDLDGKHLELIAHNFRNEYEPCVDSFGTVFVSDNDDDGNEQTRICHVIPGGNYGYHATGRKVSHWNEELPGVMPKVLRTGFGSPTGICVYEGQLLPRKYLGQLLHTDAGPRELRAFHLTPRGASYAAERELLLTSSDGWFRPADVCVAPDGSLFVADWYDPGVGGHGMGDTTRGRIYRVAPRGHKSIVPKVDLETNKGVLAALASPNLAVRYMALSKLDGMKHDDAIKVLGPAAKQTDDVTLRARALWQLARTLGPGGKHELLAGLFDDADPRFVVLGLRLARDILGHDDKAMVGHIRKQLAKKADASVLREGLVLLRTGEGTEVKDLIYDLMKRYDGVDRHYLACVGIAVGHHATQRREAILADFARHFPRWDDRVFGLVWELRPPGALPQVRQRVTDAKQSLAHRVTMVDILAGSGEAKDGERVLALLLGDQPPAVRARAVDNLKVYLPARWQAVGKSQAMDEVLTALLKQRDGKALAAELVAAAGRTDRINDMLAVARDADNAAATRLAAVRALGQLPVEGSAKGLEGLAGVPALKLEAIAALGELARRAPRKGMSDGPAAALKALQAMLTAASADAAGRGAALAALAASRQGTTWLIDRHRAGKLDASLVPAAGRLLRNSPYQDLRNRAHIAFPPPARLDVKKLPAITALAARRGDVEKGKRLLADSLKGQTQCLKCHTVRGVGGAVGPDLSMIGKKASRENLFESILLPSKAIADQYVTWTVETTAGLALSGLIVEDTAAGVVIRDAEGRDTRVPKGQIESRKKGAVSLMPDDLVAQMTEDELVDMVEYLLTLKTASLGVTAWDIVGPFDNGAGMAGLDRAFGPEKGIDLKASYDGKHGKVSWRAVKAGAGGYVDLAAYYGKQAAQTVSYLTAVIESPAEQEATLLLGTDDGAKVWVEGKLVHTARQTRAAAPEQDVVKVKLKKGDNRVVVKINNGDGPHGLYFTVLSEQELKPAARK